MMFAKKKIQKLAIEKDSQWVKWVLVSFSGATSKIEEMGVFSQSDPKAAAKFQALIKKYKIRSGEVSACLPRHQVTARNLELPSTDPDEIKKIVDLQAVKQTPYAADEIVFDYYLLKMFREGYSNVMLVIAHREVLNSHLKLLQEAGFPSPRITWATECSALWVANQLNLGDSSPMIAVLDIDYDHADFFICQGGSVFFTQSFFVGAAKLDVEGSTAGEKLIEELARAIQIYRSEEISKEPAFLVLTGAFECLTPLTESISKATGLSLKTAALPEDVTVFLGQPDNQGEWTGKSSFSSVLGMARSKKGSALNLVPQEVRITAMFVEKTRDLLIAAIFCLAIFLTVVAEFGTQYYYRQSYLTWLQKLSIDSQVQAEAVARKRARIKEIINRDEASAKFFKELPFVFQSIPNEIYLTEMSLGVDDHFFIQGRANSMVGVFNFVNSLKADKSFKNVETKHLNKRIVDNNEIVDFEIECSISYRSGIA